jgi:hypothetical protein
LSKRCGSLDLSHPYGPSRPVTGVALLLLLYPKTILEITGTVLNDKATTFMMIMTMMIILINHFCSLLIYVLHSTVSDHLLA